MSASADLITLRPLGVADAEPYRRFRLAALRETPSAFTSSHAEEADKPLAATLRRLAAAQDGPGTLIGAFDNTVAARGRGALVGTAGLKVPSRSQERHKATLYGMAVARDAAAWAVGRTGEGGAVRAQLLDLAGDHEAAVTHYRAAAEQTTSRSEREHLLRQAHRTS
ncbi:hypothetical protein ACFU7Z_06345 [Kitasatospora sp. NPDC057518]|uniref:hypothetical protein n=1 Tax=Kitasatospora sp. NPDC057518 TaxID=3346155 RepID=UPI0036B205DB